MINFAFFNQFYTEQIIYTADFNLEFLVVSISLALGCVLMLIPSEMLKAYLGVLECSLANAKITL